MPAASAPGAYGATVLVRLSSGMILHLPVLVTVPLHDSDTRAGVVGTQGAYASDRDVFGKADTVWPSVLGAANGAGADWTVFPVDLATTSARSSSPPGTRRGAATRRTTSTSTTRTSISSRARIRLRPTAPGSPTRRRRVRLRAHRRPRFCESRRRPAAATTSLSTARTSSTIRPDIRRRASARSR